MFHHLGLVVTDFSRSVSLYEACLAPLDIWRLEVGDNWIVLGGHENTPFLWLGSERPDFWTPQHNAGATPIHIAFMAPDRLSVNEFHAAALAYGAKDNGAPGPRKSWANFYSAFMLDPDGNNIEATVRE